MRNCGIIKVKALLKLFCNIFPEIGCWWAYWLWFKTYRRRQHSRERILIKQATKRIFSVNHNRVVEYGWGTSEKKVLLVHGWGSRASHFYYIIKGLSKAGYKVISLDLPGHGASSGQWTDILQITEALKKVAPEHLSFEAVISHSFGSVPVAYLLKAQRLKTMKLIMLSPLADYRYLIEKFAERLTLNSKVEKLLINKLEKRFGENMWAAFSPMENLKNCVIPTLIIHDKSDTTLPIKQGKQILGAMSHAKFIETVGLGHQKIILNHSIVKHVNNFISN